MAEQNMGGIYYTIDANTKEYIDQTNQTIAANRKMGKSFDGVDGAVKKSNQGMASFGRGAGQVGIQVQQLVGQIQGGQNAFQAFGAQAADIGIVLGAPLVGVIAALGAAVAGTLLPTLFDSGDALDKVSAATERLQASLTLSANGIEGYSEQMKTLVSISEALARVKLANLLADQRAEMQAAATAVEESAREYRGLTTEIDLFGKRTEEGYRAFLDLDQVVSDFKADPQGNVDRLTSSLQRLQAAGADNTENGRRLISTITDLIAKYEMGKITADQLTEALNQNKLALENTGAAADDIAEKYDRLVSTLQTQTDLLGRSRSEVLEYNKAKVLEAAATEGATESQLEAISASYDAQIAYARQTEGIKAKAAAEREAAAAARESAKASAEASKSFITGFGVEGEDFNGDNPDSMATGFSRSISAENETVLEQLQRQREMIQLYQELEIGDAQAHADALVAISEKEAQEKQRINSQMLSAYSSFFGESAGLVEAFAGESSGAYKALFAVSKGFAIANAALQLQTAIANAMAVPFPANIPLISQAVALGGQVASSIAGINYGGGRATGGPVSANSMYRMGEGNRPEVLQTGAGMFAVPGDSGRVFNQSQLDKIEGGSGGGMPNITINNQPGVISTVLSADEKEVIINSAVNRAENNYVGQMNNKDGKMFNANSRNFGSGKTSGRPQ